MLSEPDPTTTRTGNEYRRDLPFGISTSLMSHVVAILFLSVVAASFAVWKTPSVPQVPSQPITIETLVRAPLPPVPTKRAIVEVQAPGSSSLAPSTASGHGHRSISHPAQAAMEAATVRKELATISHLPQIKPAKARKLYTAVAVSAGDGQITANAVPGGPATDKGNDPSSGVDGDVGGRGHNGTVWSERPGTSPLGGVVLGPGNGGAVIIIGHGHDDCTPSRGGFYR
jgi:hypothetical protein